MAVAAAKPQEHNISVTLKGDQKESMWIVFHGTPEAVKADLIETFAWDKSASETLPVVSLAINAEQEYKALLNASRGLGGRIIASTPATNAGAAQAEQKAEEPVDINAVLRAKVAATKSVEDLQRLWAENQSHFKDELLLAAWKARGLELTPA